MTPLPPLFQPSPPHLSDTLPELHSVFLIPKLEDRPQNPIVEALEGHARFPDLLERDENEVVSEMEDKDPRREEAGVVEDAWTAEEVAGTHAPKVHSWYPSRTCGLIPPLEPKPLMGCTTRDVFKKTYTIAVSI